MKRLNYKALQVTMALLVCLLIAGTTTSDGSALSRSPEASGPMQAQLQVKQQLPGQPGQPDAPVGSGFTYQGSLKNGGSPANGQYDFQFTLYDALTGGNVVGSIVTTSNVTVTVGLFTVLLDFGQLAFTGEARYLAIAVRPTGGGAYTTLTPRQSLTPVPYALSLKPGAVISATTGTILTAINNDNGIGLYGSSANGYGVYGSSFFVGVYGSSVLYGVQGNTTDGTGVVGSSTNGNGVWGSSANGYGVYGLSNTDIGVYGQSSSLEGVRGQASTGYPGVAGSNLGAGPGVRGDSATGPGVYGFSPNIKGVQGVSTDGYGVHGSTTGYGYGVYGTSTNGDGVYGTSSTDGTGVVGDSFDGRGVAGFSDNGDGVWGSSIDGYGVDGFSTNSYGVFGSSTAQTGVRGETGSVLPGVHGYNSRNTGGGPGVRGDSISGPGVYGVSTTNYAGWFQGNVRITGTCCSMGAGTTQIDHPLDPANKYLNQSVVESPDMKTIYDGIAKLDATGEAWVDMPSYSESLNQDFRYQLTPIGAPGRDLYIAQEVENNRFKIAGGQPGMKVSWQVTGIRHDPYAEQHPVTVEQDKPADEKGQYLHPTEYGQPETMGIGYEQSQRAKPQLQLPAVESGR